MSQNPERKRRVESVWIVVFGECHQLTWTREGIRIDTIQLRHLALYVCIQGDVNGKSDKCHKGGKEGHDGGGEGG